MRKQFPKKSGSLLLVSVGKHGWPRLQRSIIAARVRGLDACCKLRALLAAWSMTLQQQNWCSCATLLKAVAHERQTSWCSSVASNSSRKSGAQQQERHARTTQASRARLDARFRAGPIFDVKPSIRRVRRVNWPMRKQFPKKSGSLLLVSVGKHRVKDKNGGLFFSSILSIEAKQQH